MRMQWRLMVAAWIGITAMSVVPAGAQTDLALSGYRTFASATSGNGTAQTPSNSEGGMLSFRHIIAPLIGYEGGISFNPANATLAPDGASCGYFCHNPTTPLSVKNLELSAVWVASIKVGSLRPFVLGGPGIMIFVPSTTATIVSTNTIARVAYIGGGGVDVGLGPRAGIRLQYRDSFYSAPDLLPEYPSTGKYTQTGEAMVGFYFRPWAPK